MKWLLIYIAIAQSGPKTDTLEFESRALCEQRGIALLEFSQQVGLQTKAICRSAETGEEFEVRLPKRTAA